MNISGRGGERGLEEGKPALGSNSQRLVASYVC